MASSSSRSALGSSSTTTARLVISRRKRAGISSIASATSFSNCARVTVSFLRHHEPKIIAIVADRTLVAERLRLADAPAVEDLHIRRERPHLLRQPLAQLLF